MTDPTRDRIQKLVQQHRVLLFMKGDRHFPQCGFSAQVVQILDSLLPDYATVDVLQDPELREGIKAFSSWPTIPQLYVDGEFQDRRSVGERTCQIDQAEVRFVWREASRRIQRRPHQFGTSVEGPLNKTGIDGQVKFGGGKNLLEVGQLSRQRQAPRRLALAERCLA